MDTFDYLYDEYREILRAAGKKKIHLLPEEIETIQKKIHAQKGFTVSAMDIFITWKSFVNEWWRTHEKKPYRVRRK